MESWLLFATLLVLSLLWLYFHTASKRSKLATPQSKSQPSRSAPNYHGVSIHLCPHPCQNVMAFERKRFLATEVTQLPVAGCTNRQCHCTYQHHSDRRSGEDRRYPSIVTQSIFSSQEQRFSHDRRKQHFA